MERPASQSENLRPSGLKPPSRLPALSGTKALSETSLNNVNSRNGSGYSGMGPPSVVPSKHRATELPEPPTKRKTLAERAAEPLNSFRSHLPENPKASAVNTHARAKSQPQNILRNAASSVPGNSMTRPFNRQNGFRLGQPQQLAPNQATEMWDEAEESTDSGVLGNRKGTEKFSLFVEKQATLRKARRCPGQLAKQQRQLNDMEAASQSSQQAAHLGPYNIRSCSTVSSAESNSSGAYSCTTRSSSTSSNVAVPKSKEARAWPEETKRLRIESLRGAFAKLSLSPETKRSSSEDSSSMRHSKHRPSNGRITEGKNSSRIPKSCCTPALRHAAPCQALRSTPNTSPLKHKTSSTSFKAPNKPPGDCAAAPLTFPDSCRVTLPVFLTKEKLTPLPAWDTKGRLEDMEALYAHLKTQFQNAASQKTSMEETLAVYKTQIQDLKAANHDLMSENKNLTSDLERARNDLHTITTDLLHTKRDHERDMLDMERRVGREVADLQLRHDKEMQRLEREREKLDDRYSRDKEDAERESERSKREELDEVRRRHREDLQEVKEANDSTVAQLQLELEELKRSGEGKAAQSANQVETLRGTVTSTQAQLDAANATITALRSEIDTVESRAALVEQEKAALVSKTHFLEGNQEAQSLEFTSLSDQLQRALQARDDTLDILRKEEVLRRKLNATILDLRGSIRVFVRTRPLLGGEDNATRIDYPDRLALDGGKEMAVYAPTTYSATGKERHEKHQYAFDRVFGGDATNCEVFEGCRDLIQSVIDGYNVSILSYGQTGSGKTYGMTGAEGIIPSSIALLISEIQRLKGKGWEYSADASFVEVYNETLNDLLGDAKSWDDAGADDSSGGVRSKKKEKHEIHHDAQSGKTSVTNLSSTRLWPPADPDVDLAYENAGTQSLQSQRPVDRTHDVALAYMQDTIASLLDTAASNRRVAATKANERSSRSHSIFILTMKGRCEATNESSEGILNLVDLAGSERLKQSGAEGCRMKETQAINKSLSSLGDVIAALGSKGASEAHVPYRNSKLTYLLQSSLGGTTGNGKSSRTLMLLHLSPLAQHWQESRSSLLFGTKVHGTHIGTAKRK